MKEIALFYLAKPKYGGWVSYTSHLALCLENQGYKVHLFKISNRSEKFGRQFCDRLNYFNVSISDAESLVMTYRSLITASGPDYEEASASLMSLGANIVIHDPTEMRPKLTQAIKKPCITIGKLNVSNLEKKGVKSVLIKHPYYAPVSERKKIINRAVCYSRIDWDKNTLMVAGANELLPDNKKIVIYGAMNKLYAHHKIDKTYPNWLNQYKGKFSLEFNSGFNLAASADYCVDLSVIKGDGGRTQYTFLEAWAAGTPIIVHNKWLSPEDSTMLNGHNCLAVSNQEELASQILKDPDQKLIQNGTLELAAHGPGAVVKSFVEVI